MINFLNKTALFLVIITIIASSCDEYPGPTLGKYKVPQNEPDWTYAGLPYLTYEIQRLKTEISSTQTAIAILPESSSITKLKDGLTAINGKLDSIVSTLYKIAGYGYANRAIIEDLKTELTTLQTNIAKDNIALKYLAVVIGTTNDALSTRLNALVMDNKAIADKIPPVLRSMYKLSSFHDEATQLAIDAFNIQLAAAKVSYQVLLATLLP